MKPQKKQNHLHFLSAWIRSPLKIGAVMPSSRQLSFAMAKAIDTSVEGIIIELGAGTGAVTHALLASGIPAERLLVVEREPRLHAIMQMHYPALNIVRADACELGALLAEQKITNVAAIVSSLPLMSMPAAIRHAIEQQMANAIGTSGRIIQFTYSSLSPIGAERLRSYRIFGKREKFVIGNIPPAHVWVYKRDRRIKKRG